MTTTSPTSFFDLPSDRAAEADPALIARDEAQFARIAAALAAEISEVEERRARLRALPAGDGEAALERDLEIHRLTDRLRVLRRFGPDACLGRMVPEGGGDPIYLGRIGLVAPDGQRLLVDWRSPAAEPFFAATSGTPMGLAGRRRYTWSGKRVSGYWDEAFTAEGMTAAVDDQSAFIASLSTERSPRMRDVLATIQADQDAIIRAPARGALVVDGGPGTGKTVVALHRAAYLLYADPQLSRGRGGVLFVGPHRPYLAYVSDILPGLGEDGVQLCTLPDLVTEGADAPPETDPRVAALKADARMVSAIEPAVRLYEEPPRATLTVSTPWADLEVGPAEWGEAFAAVEPGTAHNDARDVVWEELLDILLSGWDDGDAPLHQVRRALAAHEDLRATFQRAWPLVEAAVLVADLWSTPAYLRRCAPWLSAEEVALLQREPADAWTLSDLPLLDAARRRLGDPRASQRRRRAKAEMAREQEYREEVTEYLVGNDQSELGLLSILRGDDARNSLVDEAAHTGEIPDLLAGPFGHIIVDEAQEVTDAEWAMLRARCPSGSMTIVGDRAQARHGFTESWTERLERVGVGRSTVASLTVNYRTPAEIMAVAAPVILAALPDANVPTSVRSTGEPVRYGERSERDGVIAAWLAAHTAGIACVIGDPGYPGTARVRSLTPELSKGLEFDLVVLVDPDAFGAGIAGAVDRYVAMTRATGSLVILR